MLNTSKWEIIVLVISIILVLCVIVDNIVNENYTSLTFSLLIPMGLLGYYLLMKNRNHRHE